MFKKLFKFTVVYTLIAMLVNFQIGSLGVAERLNFLSSKAYAAEGLGVFEGDKTGGGNWMSAITLVAIGVIAGSLLKCKVKTTDTITAAVGGAIYIFGEVQAYNKDSVEKATVVYSQDYSYDENGQLADADRDALLKQRALYEKSKKTLEAKSKMQKAAAAAFAAAAGLAYWGHYKLEKAKTECEQKLNPLSGKASTGATMCNAIGKSCSAVEKICATGVGSKACSKVPERCDIRGKKCGSYLDNIPSMSCRSGKCALAQEGLKNCKTKIDSAKKQFQKVEVAKKLMKASTDQAKKIDKEEESFMKSVEGCKGNYKPNGYSDMVKSCKEYDVLLNKSLNRCTQAITAFNENSIINIATDDKIDFLDNLSNILGRAVKKTVQSTCNFIIPEANAMSFNPTMLGFAGGVLGGYMAMKSTKVNFIDKYLATYKKRAIVFGLLAGLAYMAAKETDKTIEKLKGYIAKIDEILASIDERSSGKDLDAASDGTTKLASSIGSSGSGTGLVPYQSYTPTYSGNTPCITANCRPVEGELYGASDIQAMGGLNGQGSGGSAILGSAKKASKIGSLIQGKKKISAGAMNAMGALGGQYGAIRNANDKLKRAINSDRIANGKGPIDFNAENKDMLNNIRSDGAKALKSMGFSGAKGGASGSSGGLSNSNVKKMLKAESAPKKAGVVYSSGKKGNGNIFGDENMNGAFDHSALENQNLDTAGELAKYDNSDSDILGKGVSIFKVISSRYIKSGMRRVLGMDKKKNNSTNK